MYGQLRILTALYYTCSVSLCCKPSRLIKGEMNSQYFQLFQDKSRRHFTDALLTCLLCFKKETKIQPVLSIFSGFILIQRLPAVIHLPHYSINIPPYMFVYLNLFQKIDTEFCRENKLVEIAKCR